MNLFPQQLHETATALVRDLTALGLRIATAESCTGGLLAGLLTEIPGSSLVLDRGFVVYSNEAKSELLDVDLVLIMGHGAVSEPVARAMAEGTLARSNADLALSVTGIAGPDGGSEHKPVGLVHFACATRDGATSTYERRYGNTGRRQVRLAALADALAFIRQRVPTA